MRLSEAIRLGATMKPQAFGAIFENGGTCARGAALDAAGIRLESDRWYQTDWFRWAQDLKVKCPACSYHGQDLSLNFIITYCLNDHHKWTREQIADWVELHEPLPIEIGEPELLEAKVAPMTTFERPELPQLPL